MKVLVIDDHALIREAMSAVVRDAADAGDDVELLQAQTAVQAMQVLNEHPDIDLIVLDLGLPDRDGLDLLAEVRDQFPLAASLILSARDDPATIRAVLDHGAQGFLPKSATRAVMVGALRLVLSGGRYVPPELLALPTHSASTLAQAGPNSPAHLGLTPRQIDVLALLVQGKSNKLICRSLGLAETTVKNHVTAILRAMGVTNRTEAAVRAAELGWTFKTP